MAKPIIDLARIADLNAAGLGGRVARELGEGGGAPWTELPERREERVGDTDFFEAEWIEEVMKCGMPLLLITAPPPVAAAASSLSPVCAP